MLATRTDGRPVDRQQIRRWGLLTVLGGVLGAISALVIIVWPEQVAESRFSYPFDATSYVVAQLFFAGQHLLLLAGLVALVPLTRSSARLTRVGVWTSVVGMVGLTACELFALTATGAALDSTTGETVSAAYGLPTVLIGTGLVLAGVGMLRRPVLGRRGDLLVLVTGGYVFVVLLPALFGSLVVGRLAIGTWMLMFAAIGAALARTSPGGAAASS